MIKCVLIAGHYLLTAPDGAWSVPLDSLVTAKRYSDDTTEISMNWAAIYVPHPIADVASAMANCDKEQPPKGGDDGGGP